MTLVDLDKYEEKLPIAYSAFALFRVAFGLSRLIKRRGPDQASLSSSALRATAERKQHYENVIRFVAKHGITIDLRDCASWMQTKARLLSNQ